MVWGWNWGLHGIEDIIKRMVHCVSTADYLWWIPYLWCLCFIHSHFFVYLLQGFTGLLNLIEFVGNYIPTFLYNNQVLIVTCFKDKKFWHMSIQWDTLPLISCLYVLYISQLLYTSKFLLLYLEESFPHPPSCIHSEMIPFTLNGLLKFSITKAEDSTHICISIGCVYVSMC